MFAVRKERFLGFLVSSKGIKPILRRFKQYKTWLLLKRSKMFNTSLETSHPNIFISKLGEYNLPFCKILKNITNFKWTSKCQKAFEEFKAYIFSSMILSQPRETESIFLYFGVSNQTVNFILVKEKEGMQCPIYYSYWTLNDVKTMYLKVEKMTLTLVRTSRKPKS